MGLQKKIKFCWEYMKCPEKRRKLCPAFNYGMGDKCWSIYKIIDVCPNIKKDGDCFNCAWYKKNNRL